MRGNTGTWNLLIAWVTQRMVVFRTCETRIPKAFLRLEYVSA